LKLNSRGDRDLTLQSRKKNKEIVCQDRLGTNMI
jgi:hypothetical protein